MSDKESIIAKFPEDGSITFDGETFNYPAPPPPDKILMRDESGQPWAITVRPDGQLQTAKYPDGEPMTPSDYESKKIMAIFDSMGK